MKKLLLAAAAAFVFTSVVTAEVKFTNKVFEEDAILMHYEDEDGDKETVHDFPAVKERMQAEITTDRVDAMVKADIVFDDHNGRDFGFAGVLQDWYIEFRPTAEITLGMHDNIYTTGSYLPVVDSNMNNGNIGDGLNKGDGFVFVYSPAAMESKLRLAASAPVFGTVNYVDGEEKDWQNDPFVLSLGAIFAEEYFEIGGTIKDVMKGSGDRSFGAYVNLPGLFGNAKEISLFALGITLDGQGINDCIDLGTISGGVTGDTIFNFGLQCESDVTVAADILYNGGENNAYDLYLAGLLGVGVEEFDVSLYGKALFDLKDDGKEAKPQFDAGCEFDLAVDKSNTVYFGAEAAFCDGAWALAIPAGWKYTFKQ